MIDKCNCSDPPIPLSEDRNTYTSYALRSNSYCQWKRCNSAVVGDRGTYVMQAFNAGNCSTITGTENEGAWVYVAMGYILRSA